MKFPRLTSRRWLLAATLIVFYLASYGWARSNRILVHYRSYATEGGGKRYFHRIETGDFGGPGALLQSPAAPVINGCSLIFTPLRWFESAVWSFIPTQP
jgi:hypothetical protein